MSFLRYRHSKRFSRLWLRRAVYRSVGTTWRMVDGWCREWLGRFWLAYPGGPESPKTFDCQGQTSVRRGIATTLALPLIRHRWSIAYVVRHSILLPEHQQQHQHTQSYLGV